jgi:hypothetical protein
MCMFANIMSNEYLERYLGEHKLHNVTANTVHKLHLLLHTIILIYKLMHCMVYTACNVYIPYTPIQFSTHSLLRCTVGNVDGGTDCEMGTLLESLAPAAVWWKRKLHRVCVKNSYNRLLWFRLLRNSFQWNKEVHHSFPKAQLLDLYRDSTGSQIQSTQPHPFLYDLF